MRGLRLAVLAVLVLALPLAARPPVPRAKEKARSKDQLVGKWTPTRRDNIVLEFAGDGRYTVTNTKEHKHRIEGTWKREGDRKFKVAFKRGDKERTFLIEVVKLTDRELVTRDPEGKE